MEFSVLLSVYYKENPEYLKQSLDSIFYQSMKPTEVILVKDGTLTSELDHIINDYVTTRKELKVVSLEENQGLGVALNQGLKLCSYELVARMDTDDIAKFNRFEKQLQQFELNPELDVIGSWIDEFIGNKDNIVTQRKVPEYHDQIYSFAKKRCPMNHPSVMFKKDAVLSAGNYQFFPLFEDYYLWVRMLKQGYKFYNIQESLLYFRTSPYTFQKRGGKEYLKNENKLQFTFYRIGFISFPQYISNMILRFFVRLSPNKYRSYLYNRFARNKK
ncbi:MAG TPA: amylovoran biosynthesis protein AmsE [Thermosipho africanus]|nr:amylovoran biosynthesis protein AmsE [Thermosipho africanus]